jgi:hypothetical protein
MNVMATMNILLASIKFMPKQQSSSQDVFHEVET